jgi:hypothetical protein
MRAFGRRIEVSRKMRKKNCTVKTIGRLALLTAGAMGAYWYLLRPWHRAWGTIPEETGRALPGDELLPHPQYDATHAVTIFAPVERVWPWIAQMGTGRAGFYSYDFIENAMGLDIHSADQIHPDLQTLKVGDVFPLGPNNFGPKVAILEPNRVMVLHGDTHTDQNPSMSAMKPGDFLAVLWTFFMEPIDAHTTRLIERFRLDYSPGMQNNVMYRALMEPGSFIMERKMLLGIKQRAES